MKQPAAHKKNQSKKGMGNPALIVAGASELAKNEKVVNTAATGLMEAGKFMKTLFILAGVSLTAYLSYTEYKKYKRRKYLENNLNNANVQAAIIIHSSFLKIEAPGFLSYLLPSWNISTDEAAIYAVAQEVTSLGEVQIAYKIIFDEVLTDSLLDGLDSAEFKTFLNIIENKGGASVIESTGTYPVYLTGDKLYQALKNKTISVKAAEYSSDSGKWHSTNELYGNYSYGSELGEVVISYIYETEDSSPSRYYIVKSGGILGIGVNYGLVWDFQITNKKIID